MSVTSLMSGALGALVIACAFALAPTPRSAAAMALQSGGAEIRISLLEQTATVGLTNRFQLRAQVGGTVGLRNRSQVEVATTVYQRLRTRAALQSSLRRERLGSPVKVVTRPLGLAAPDGSVTVDMAVDIGACADCITLASDGVYPVVMEVRRRGGADVLVDMVTFLIRQTAEVSQPLSVALAVPLHLPPALNPDGSTAEADISGFVAVAESLGSHPAVPLTIIPMWNGELAAAEVGGTHRRVSDLGAERAGP